MPDGISRLAALVIPMTALMPLAGFARQVPAAPSAHDDLKIVEIAGDFVIRRMGMVTRPPAAIRLGNAIQLDRALIARSASVPLNAHQGALDETR